MVETRVTLLLNFAADPKRTTIEIDWLQECPFGTQMTGQPQLQSQGQVCGVPGVFLFAGGSSSDLFSLAIQMV